MQFEEKTIERKEIYQGPIFKWSQTKWNYLKEKVKRSVI